MTGDPIRDIVARHGLQPIKRLGQHFLFDRNLIRRIVRAAGPLDGSDILEVGPGPGGLTEELLLAGARRVVAVERDRRCLAALGELEARHPGRLTLISDDALAVDEDRLLAYPAKVVANLPFNVATALMLKWCERPERWSSLTLMFQREVADRLVAAPNTKDYGRLSIMVQWRFSLKREFDVSPRAFVPPPRVTSTVVTLTPSDPTKVPSADPRYLERVTKAAFGQRRKMLRSSLQSLNVDPLPLLESVGIQPTARAESLTVAAFCALSESLRLTERS